MPEKFAKQVGQNIKNLRLQNGISRQQLSEAISVAYSTIGLWETGKAFPRSSAIDNLSEFFNIPREKIIGNVNEDSPPQPTNENKPIIDLNSITDDQCLVIYKNTVLTHKQEKQLELILKGLFIDES